MISQWHDKHPVRAILQFPLNDKKMFTKNTTRYHNWQHDSNITMMTILAYCNTIKNINITMTTQKHNNYNHVTIFIRIKHDLARSCFQGGWQNFKNWRGDSLDSYKRQTVINEGHDDLARLCFMLYTTNFGHSRFWKFSGKN